MTEQKVLYLRPDSVVEPRSKGAFDGRSAGIDQAAHDRLMAMTLEDWDAQARIMRGLRPDGSCLSRRESPEEGGRKKGKR